MIVTEEYYTSTYMGEAVDTAAFPRFEKRAEELVNIITKGKLKDFDTFHESIKESVKNAICAQIEYYSMNGIETSITGADTSQGFTVGKVTIQKSAGVGAKALSAAQSMTAPMCIAYLESTGLLNPQVATFDIPCIRGRGYLPC